MIFWGGGGQAMVSCRSLIIRRHTRKLSEFKIRAMRWGSTLLYTFGAKTLTCMYVPVHV